MNAFADAVRGGTQYHRNAVYGVTSINDLTPATAAVSRGTSAGWHEVIDDLLAAYKLADDWDGQGAKAPSREALATALKLAASLRSSGLRYPDEYGPSVNGEVTFYWKWAASSLLFEVSSAACVSGYEWPPGAARAVRFNLSGPTEFGS